MTNRIMNYESKSKNGTALILTLLVVAILSTVAFGVGRVFVSRARIATAFEDTQGAFYDAQSYMEVGLLVSRFQRYNIEGNISGRLLNSPELNRSVEGRYKKIDLLVESLEQDQTFEFEAPTNVGTLPMDITWDTAKKPLIGQGGLQITSIETTNSAVINFKCKYFSTTTGFTCLVPPDKTMINLPIDNPTTSKTIIRIKPIGGRIQSLCVHDGDHDCLNTTGRLIDSGIYTITAKGKYRNTARQLEVKINRQNGRLSGFFDYALISRDSIR